MKAILLFLFTFPVICNGQSVPKDKQLYSINIFVWSKIAEDSLTDKIIYIDRDGNVNINGRDNHAKLDMAAVTDGFNKFISDEKIEKTPAYGEDAIEAAYDPETGEQALHISIVRMEDYQRDKDNFTYPAEYFKLMVLPIGEPPTGLFKYFRADIVKALAKMLEE